MGGREGRREVRGREGGREGGREKSACECWLTSEHSCLTDL